jgi:hypothetical protein
LDAAGFWESQAAKKKGVSSSENERRFKFRVSSFGQASEERRFEFQVSSFGKASSKH